MEERAFRFALPSCVIPGNVADNVSFLRSKTGEIGLCFFESRACLEYGETDLPSCLADYGFRWHIHLPLDLPWPDWRLALDICERLFMKASFLKPYRAVLHPPGGVSPERKKKLLAHFALAWSKKGLCKLLLENTPDCDVLELGESFLAENDMVLCLDMGHALGYCQKKLLASDLILSAALVHWNAPGKGGRHEPLALLSRSQAEACRAAAARLSVQAVHMLEIFNWRGIMDSMPVLEAILASAGGRECCALAPGR